MKTFYASLIVSVLLLVGGFLCPPIGVIDGSVLSAVGLLLMFATIDKIPEVVKAGKSIRIQKGDLELKVSQELD